MTLLRLFYSTPRGIHFRLEYNIAALQQEICFTTTAELYI